MFQRLGEKQALPESLEALADVFGARQQPGPAARLLGAAAAFREELLTPLPPVDHSADEQMLARVCAQLDAAAFESAWALGRALTIEQASAISCMKSPTGEIVWPSQSNTSQSDERRERGP